MATFDPSKFVRTQTATYKSPTQKVIDTAKEKSVGTLKNVIDFLRTGEFAVGGLLSGVSPAEGIKRKISPSDALGIKNTISALATDIFLDPTTYITFGVGGGMKVATKGGATVVLKKAGKEAFSEAVQKYGAKEARNKFAEILVNNPQFIDEGGIKMFGQTLVSTKAIKKVLKPIASTVEKVPGVKTVVSKVKSLDEFSAAKELPNGEQFVSGLKSLPKKTRAAVLDSTEQLAKQNADFIKKYGDEFGSHVTNYIETGKIAVKNADMAEDIAKIGNEIIKVEDILAKAEMARGLLKSTLGESIGKVPAKVKTVVDKYTDDILEGTIKTADDFKKILTKGEKSILKGNNTPSKLFEKIVKSKPNTENYIKHFLTEKGRKYVEKGGEFYGAIPKPLRAKLQSGNMRTMRSSISEINEAMKGKVGGDMFEPNAFKALAARQAESIKAINIFDFIEGVKSDYGVQALKGETERVIDGVKYIKSTSPQLEGMLVPEAIAQHLDDTTKFINGDKVTNEFLAGYDKILRVWKGSVTGWFPAFHTRNFMGGAFNNWLAGVDPTMYVKAKQILSDAAKDNKLVHLAADGVEYTSKELVDLMKKTGSINQPGMIDVMEEIEGKIGKNLIQKFGEYPRVLMEATENNLRAPLFLDRVLKRGWLPEDAAKDVFKFHFDYAPEGLSTFERMWMKRLLPFYTWTRNNIPLQIEMMARNPGKYAALGKLQNTIGGEKLDEEFPDLPDWMKDQLNFRIGENNGLGLWLQLNLPVEDVAKLPLNEQGIRETVSMLSPILKVPIELITNKNLYFGTDIVNEDLKDYPELQRSKTLSDLDKLPQPLKDFLNIKKVKKKTYKNNKVVWKEQVEMDSKKLYILKSLFGRFYSAIDQIGGEETETQKMLRLLGGVPLREIDIENQRYWNEYEKQKADKAKASFEKARIEEED